MRYIYIYIYILIYYTVMSLMFALAGLPQTAALSFGD